MARPRAVICIGQNYAAHAAETGAPAPEYPIMFFKHPNTVVGPFDDVSIPRGSTRTDWEVELAVVIGARCRYLGSVDDAPNYIAGLHNFQRCLRTRISNGPLGRPVVKGEMLRDVQPAWAISGPGR